MTHIIITAGGTTEPIDGVRQITNTSTGRLGVCIYNALAEYLAKHPPVDSRAPQNDSAAPASAPAAPAGIQASGFIVHYIVSQTSVRPTPGASLPIQFYPVTDVQSVAAVLEDLMTAHKVDYVIHGMAVSDFTKKYIVAQDALAGELAHAVEAAIREEAADSDDESIRREKGIDAASIQAVIEKVLHHPTLALKDAEKISSRSELFLSLGQTPKLIHMIKKWNPDTCLVGFKLLKGASDEDLLQVGTELAQKNKCDFVLVNDLDQISGDRHRALLIRDGSVVGTYETKEEIGKGIAENIFADNAK